MASYSLDNMSFEQILERIAGDFGLTVGKLEADRICVPNIPKGKRGLSEYRI